MLFLNQAPLKHVSVLRRKKTRVGRTRNNGVFYRKEEYFCEYLIPAVLYKTTEIITKINSFLI